MTTPQHWNAQLYDDKHNFVWKHGAALLDLLTPQAGERILDVGCGTGHLTTQIAQSGARVVGMDASPEMIERARAQFPDLDWRVADATHFHFDEKFDAVFSNATLHWVRPPAAAIACLARALKIGGRLVAEFGGQGNVAKVLWSIDQALQTVGVNGVSSDVNYFPSICEYVSLLEAGGFEVQFAQLFDRPTPLEGENGLRDWATMFRAPMVEAVPHARREEFWRALETFAAPGLQREGVWFADYRRLRIVAYRTDADV